MKVVISGGTGLVGRALVASLRRDGHGAVVLTRRPGSVSGLPEGTVVAGWDAVSVEPLVEVLEGADAVVHLAGSGIAEGRWTDERKRRIRASRVESSRALAEAIGRCSRRPSALVQASAVGYYGGRGDETLTEESAPGQGFLPAVCAEWEAASAPVESLGVRRVLLRTGIVLARDGGALPRMALPFRLFVGGPVGDGKQWMPWIHLADEVAAIRFLLETEGAAGPFNLTAPEPLTNLDFCRALGRALGRPSWMPAPAFALRLVFGEMAEILLEGQRALPARLLEAGFTFRFPTAEQALGDLVGGR